MTIRKMPLLPTWLLNRLVSGTQREALLGDLFEEYQAGRTVGWYWREALVAVYVSLGRRVRELLSYRTAQSILALMAQSILVVWMVALAEQYRQDCPALPALFGDAAIPMLSAGAAQIAIAVAVWLSPLCRHIRMNARSGLVRLSVAIFATIGLSGAAITWASTASCSITPSLCASSSTVNSCVRPATKAPKGARP